MLQDCIRQAVSAHGHVMVCVPCLICLVPLLPPRPHVQLHTIAVLLFLIDSAVIPRGSSQESAAVMLSSVSTTIEIICALQVQNLKNHNTNYKRP